MDDHNTLEIGETGEASFVASDSDMASALSAEEPFPEVLATSRMIALMELSAARLMKKTLEPNQLSVGVGVFVQHLAATPNNTEVRCVARFLGKEGKLFRFKVEAFDTAGKIGEGEHTRAIIDADRLVEGARRRIDGRSTQG